jgi:hypothetical protein
VSETYYVLGDHEGKTYYLYKYLRTVIGTSKKMWGWTHDKSEAHVFPSIEDAQEAHASPGALVKPTNTRPVRCAEVGDEPVITVSDSYDGDLPTPEQVALTSVSLPEGSVTLSGSLGCYSVYQPAGLLGTHNGNLYQLWTDKNCGGVPEWRPVRDILDEVPQARIVE